MGCAHRDVKPSNILVDWKYNIKVIDFGLGNLYEENEKLRTACGSPCYAAPEIISGQLYDPMKVDIWSCGITLYTMVCGCLPFDEESKTALYDKILSCKFHLSKSLSAKVRDLISIILVKDVNKRATIDEILEHPWLNTLTHDYAESSTFEFGRFVVNCRCGHLQTCSV
jgi:5'-AMP-activated protein kinase catalytic alpha subunit